MLSEHQCFTGASGRRGWAPIVLQRDQFSMRRKMVSDGKVVPPPPLPKKKLGLLKGWVRVVFVSVCQCPYLTPCFLKLAPACSVDASCAVIPKINCPSFYRTTLSVAVLGCWTFYFLFIYIF